MANTRKECKIEDITEQDFQSYEEVRESGVTNMFMITTVSELSGLDREQILCIMKNYGELCKKYPDVVSS